MEVNRRTQAARSAATRTALIDAARLLFGRDGYAAVGTEAVVALAGVSRGALYHQFPDKAALFEATFEAVEAELTQRLADRLDPDEVDPARLLELGVSVWLDACAEPEVQRIVLLDGPSVLGWERWREIGLRHGGGMVEAALQVAIDAGQIEPQPVRPLAHVVISALDEAALYVARAADPIAARAEMTAVLRRLVAGFLLPGPPGEP